MTLLLAALFIACAPPTFPEDSLPAYVERPVEAMYDANPDATWSATLSVFSDRYPIDEVDRGRGRIVTEWVVGQSDYIFNAFAGTRIPEKIRYRMVVEVGQKNGRSQVRVRSHEQIEKDILSANLEFTGALYEWIDIPSSTRKERDALERIAEVLERGGGASEADLDYRE
jgi:hypothetical protein